MSAYLIADVTVTNEAQRVKYRDMAAARAYCDSETYTQARRVREGAGSIAMVLVDGVN